MACFERNSCNSDNYECDINTNVVSGATDNQANTCGCGCCCNCCGCGCNNGCGAVGGTTGRNCGPRYYVTNAQCDCEEVEETTCNRCGMCD
ncbi:MAG: hypothetical protein IKU84_03610 [Clostridia bacterium]|nr:hypothetical protein [Clostridia bacterium]